MRKGRSGFPCDEKIQGAASRGNEIRNRRGVTGISGRVFGAFMRLQSRRRQLGEGLD